MEAWFAKYPREVKPPTEKHALAQIHSRIHEARKHFLEDEPYMELLADAYMMLSDFFEVKGVATPRDTINPTIVETKLLA